MGNARCERGINAIEIDRHVKWAIKLFIRDFVERVGAQHRNAVFFAECALLRRCASNADLHKAADATVLNRARKRAGVRKRIALELIIKVWMRINMQNIDRPVGGQYSAY